MDDQHLFRGAVAVALVGIVLLRGQPSPSPFGATYGAALALLVVPTLGPSLALAFLSYRLLARWPVLILALLTLPLDPWLAEPLAWPLRRLTALLGGALSFCVPYDSTGTWLPVTWTMDAPSYGGREPFMINDKCAGLAQVESMLALISAMLLVTVERFRQKPAVLLVICAPLVAIGVNGVRVAVSMWLGWSLRRGPWEGWIHDIPAFVCFGILVYFLLRLIRSFETVDQPSSDELEST